MIGHSMRTEPPHKAYFASVELKGQANDGLWVSFHPAPGSEELKMPERMRRLIESIVEMEHVIDTVFLNSPGLRERFYQHLCAVGRVGVCGDHYNVDNGFENLAAIKSEIADQFPAVRTYYWKRYGYLVLWCVVLLLLGSAAYFGAIDKRWGVPELKNGVFSPEVALPIAALWIPAGAAVGLFLEYAFRVDRVITYEKLQTINPARWNPFQRFVNTTVTGYVLAALMGFGIFQVGVSTVLLNDFWTTKPYLSLLIGFVSGFATPYVQDIIGQVRPTRQEGQSRTRRRATQSKENQQAAHQPRHRAHH